MSERDILRKTTELQLQLISHLPLKKGPEKGDEGTRGLRYYSIPPEAIVTQAWCQPCAINHCLSEEGRQAGDTPSRIAGWWFSCPPPTFSPVLQPHTRNSDSCFKLSRDLRAPVQQRQLPAHSLPQPPPPLTTPFTGYVFHPPPIVVTFYLLQSPSGCT
ncbi:uncharacterized [Tachysurus ichikawai]